MKGTRIAWRGVAGWVLMLAALLLALFVVPFPLNGYAVLATVLAATGAALVIGQVKP